MSAWGMWQPRLKVMKGPIFSNLWAQPGGCFNTSAPLVVIDSQIESESNHLVLSC